MNKNQTTHRFLLESALKQLRQTPDGCIYSDSALEKITGKTKVSKDQGFVLGDNREVSKDGRMFGFIS